MLKDGQLGFRFEQQQHLHTQAHCGSSWWVWGAGNLKEGDHLEDLGVDGGVKWKGI